MRVLFVIFLCLFSGVCQAQDTIYTESKVEIVNGQLPEEGSEFSEYYSLNKYSDEGIEIYNETRPLKLGGSYFIHHVLNENEWIDCYGSDVHLNCVKTSRDTMLNMEYDHSQGDTFAIRKLYFDEEKLIKVECVFGCEYAINYSKNGDTLTEFKQNFDSTYMYSYKILDDKERMIFNVDGSQNPIFEGYYYFDTYDWDDENYTSLKVTSASNSSPFYREKTFYDDQWIPLRKEVNYKNRAGFFDNYTIRYTRDTDSTLTLTELPDKWIRLTETDTGFVIFNHCAGGNYKVSISETNGKKSLLEYGEQEDAEYWVNGISQKDDTIVFSVESKLDGAESEFLLHWVDRLKGTARWISGDQNASQRNELLVFRDFRNHFPVVDMPCVECWGDECDE